MEAVVTILQRPLCRQRGPTCRVLSARSWDLRALVSRGGRPELAGAALDRVRCPTPLIVGGRNDIVVDLDRRAERRLDAIAEVAIVLAATHLFRGARCAFAGDRAGMGSVP